MTRLIAQRMALAVILTVSSTHFVLGKVPEYKAVAIKTYPHDPEAFTEGLFYKDGFLYESTGITGRSSIRKVLLTTGEIVQRHDLDAAYYGEGIVSWKNKLIGLTYKSEIGFVYDAQSFHVISDFHYKGEGWGLTQDGANVIMSDGTADLRVLDPESLAEHRRIHVTCDGRAIHNINELEWVRDKIFANVWLTNAIIRIDPSTGQIDSVIDVSALTALSGGDLTARTPNGIAYDAVQDRLFITGKLWPSLYEVTISKETSKDDGCQDLP